MGIKDVTDLQYLIPRVILWVLLFCIALGDSIRHRHIKRRGNQLPWGILIVLGASVVQEVMLLTYSACLKTKNPDADYVRRAYYVFDDLEDGLFMALLLAIAAGFCITRDNLGPHKLKIIITPIVFFVSKVVLNLATDILRLDDPDFIGEDVGLGTFLILYLADVVSLMAFMLAIVFVFEISAAETNQLIGNKEGIVGAVRDVETGRPSGSTTAANGEQGHTVNLPARATENGQPLNEVYAEVTGNDTDVPETVEDKLQNRTKIRLMKQFRWAAVTCISCYLVALIVPLFYYSTPDDQGAISPDDSDTFVLVVLILWNAVRFCFLAALAFIFRVRETNPYLLLDEMDGGLDNDFSSTEIRTELGVLTNSNSEMNPTSSDGINHNFSLDDEDEEQNRKGSAKLIPASKVKSNID